MYVCMYVCNLREEHNCSCKQCSAVGLYAMCYSVAKSCSYWNSRTLCCIADQGNKLYRHMGIKRCLEWQIYAQVLIFLELRYQFNLKLKAMGYYPLKFKQYKKQVGKLNFQQLQWKYRFLIVACKLLYYLYFSTNSQSKVHVLPIDL